MLPYLRTDGAEGAVPLWPVTAAGLPAWLARQDAAARTWATQAGFTARPGTLCPIPGEAGALAGVAVGMPEDPDLWSFAGLPAALPAATYRFDDGLDAAAATPAAIGWGLGTYAYSRYRQEEARRYATLVVPAACDVALARRTIAATFFVRDLINTPAADMGPAELADAAASMAPAFKARLTVTRGEDLLRLRFPAIHAVGRASAQAPRLIDLRWGRSNAPRVTLVGKGVCFDTGGLDLKPASAMRLMKKDMGGAATVLGLAHMIMDAGLDVRLRVLVPAVENSVDGSAMRPGDVVATRKGLSVEIGNTDAEGRVILADALAFADEEAPDLLVDCATLTGAARSALGPDLPALFTDDDALAADLARHGAAAADPLWRLPLWAPYRELIDSKIADISNSGESPFAGAITAALFLKDFVSKATRWAHIDLYGWSPRDRPGRPTGGEAQAMRALFALVAARYGTA